MKIRTGMPLQARRGDPKGQVLVLFALVLVVLLLVSALAIDYGGWLVSKRTYQNAADAASLAGAQQLTRPLNVAECGGAGSGISKQYCARQAAWDSVKAALGLTVLDPVVQANGPGGFSTAYVENGYRIWVASPPSDAGAAWLGHVTGGGTVYVRIEQHQTGAISHIGQNVVAWATAGRFPANFAVIGMCRPAAGDNCLAPGGDANIHIAGSNSILAVETGDMGTNAFVKTSGNTSAIGLGPDSNAFMEQFEDCWDGPGNCQLVGYSGGAADYSDIRSAVPLGAPIVDPGYSIPPLGAGTPAQCGLVGSTASIDQNDVTSSPVELDWGLVADVAPLPSDAVANLAGPTKISGTVFDNVGNKLQGATVSITAGPGAPYTQVTGNNGAYSFTVTTGGTFTIQATYPNYSTQTFNITVASSSTYPQDFTLTPNPGIIQGFVTLGGSGVGGVTVSTNGGLTATTVPGTGGYAITNVPAGTWQVSATMTGYIATPNPASVIVTPGSTKSQDFTLAAFVGGVASGTVKDAATLLQLPGATVTATGPGGTYTAVTDTNGMYSISNMVQGNYTFVVSRTGYTTTSPSSGNVPSGGTLTKNFDTASSGPWPSHCGVGGNTGDWSCGYGAEGCPLVTGDTGPGVTCAAFDDTNRIRPGTYDNISIAAGKCAWIDAKGGPTRMNDDPDCWTTPTLAKCAQPGILHVKGEISLGNGAFLFGDGVTIVFDQGSDGINPGNGAGFVLNYGTTDTTFATPFNYGDSGTPCFRTTGCAGPDYAYSGWTTNGMSPWTCTPSVPPTYSTGCMTVGQDIGIAFYLRGDGMGNQSRFRASGANWGYQFNGVLYGPRDEISLGGGHNGQSAAGQIVGWTIKYHGGTRILQNWYGDPVDGPPFLIEPILGE